MRPLEELKEIAARRTACHNHPEDWKPSSEDQEINGVITEATFEDSYGYLMDDTERPAGDPGWDFVCDLKGGGTVKVDTKGFKNPYNMLVPVDQCMEDIIYILYHYDPDTMTSRPVGWEWGYIMMRCPYKTFGKYNIVNYHKSAPGLKRMDAFESLIVNKKHEKH